MEILLSNEPAVRFHIVMVDVEEKDYESHASAMDDAVRTGNLRFFDDPKDQWVWRTADIYLRIGQPGW